MVWESVLGFLAVFDVLAFIQAVWNITRGGDDIAVWPSLLLLVLLILTWRAWRCWRRYR